MDENNQPKEKKSFSQKYISKYIALDLKTLIPVFVFVASISYGAYQTFTRETKTELTRLATACNESDKDIGVLKSQQTGTFKILERLEKGLEKLDGKIDKNHDLLVDHITRTKKSGH